MCFNLKCGWKCNHFVVIYENNRVVFADNSTQEIEDTFENNKYIISSSGYDSSCISSITVNGDEYSLNQTGINIVVYNNNQENIVDSVAFIVVYGSGAYRTIIN